MKLPIVQFPDTSYHLDQKVSLYILLSNTLILSFP